MVGQPEGNGTLNELLMANGRAGVTLQDQGWHAGWAGPDGFGSTDGPVGSAQSHPLAGEIVATRR